MVEAGRRSLCRNDPEAGRAPGAVAFRECFDAPEQLLEDGFASTGV